MRASAPPARSCKLPAHRGTGESPLAAIPDWIDVCTPGEWPIPFPASGPRPDGAHWIRARRRIPTPCRSGWIVLVFTSIPRSGNPAQSPTGSCSNIGEFPISTSAEPKHAGSSSALCPVLAYVPPRHRCGPGTRAVSGSCFIRASYRRGRREDVQEPRNTSSIPTLFIGEYGTDSLRLYLMFLGPPRGDETVEPAPASKACSGF